MGMIIPDLGIKTTPCRWRRAVSRSRAPRGCRCSRISIERYRARLSGPLLDRLDLHVRVAPVEVRSVFEARSISESSTVVRLRVARARERQLARRGALNSALADTTSTWSHLIDFIGAPYGIRTRVTALRGLCPGPLDEGSGIPGRGRERGIIESGPDCSREAQ